MNTYLLNNVEKKLKKSISKNCSPLDLKSLTFFPDKNNITKLNLKNIISSKNKNFVISFSIKKFFYYFLIFFSRKFLNRKKNLESFLSFLKFYEYLNSFFFNNKLFFFKKYALKKKDPSFLRKFFLYNRHLHHENCLKRLKDKRINFYKKNIWTKKVFRKKNILIFNNIFFKKYIIDRHNPFIVESLLNILKPKNSLEARLFRKNLFSMLFHVKYRYSFFERKYNFKKFERKYNKIFSPNLYPIMKTGPAFFVKKYFIARRKRKVWRQVYFLKKYKSFYLRFLFYSFNLKSFDFFSFLCSKHSRKNYNKIVFKEYFTTFFKKLKIKHFRVKHFYKKVWSRRKFHRRIKNVFYFLKWKPKKIFFPIINIFKINKSSKNFVFNLVWFKFNLKKIIWKKKKNFKLFFLFFFNNYFFNKSFISFNTFLNTQFFFTITKRRKRFFRFRRRKLTFYSKKRRRRIIRKRVKRKFLRIFIILLLLKLMKKHKNFKRFLVLRNALFLNNFKKIKLRFLYYIFFSNDNYLYFKKNNSIPYSGFEFLNKEDLKIISLLKKN